MIINIIWQIYFAKALYLFRLKKHLLGFRKIHCNDKKNFRQKIVSLTKKYLENDYFDISKQLDSVFSASDISKFEESDLDFFEKMNALLFLGQLVGLPTLKSILTKFGIASNRLQKNYTKLYKKLTVSKLRIIFEFIFERQAVGILREMALKDSSIWSKKRVAAVLDDSIFRQWLSGSARDGAHYGKFFSGQYHCSVFGFKVVCFGLYIDGIFYPLFFDFVKKKTGEQGSQAIEVAKKLVSRWGRLKGRLAREGVMLPNIHFSCDNGYNGVSLSEHCERQENGLVYISVPRRNNIFIIDEKRGSLTEFIDSEFMTEELAHRQNERHLKEESKTPFCLRKKAFYHSQQRYVTLLFFRLNGSGRVSVIYSPSETIFAKTLRRHWFSRTYIEQFFKTLKHVLRITEARTKDRHELEFKILRFAFMAVEAQRIVKFLRRKFSAFKGKGFIALQRILCFEQEIIDLLQSKTHIKY